MGWPFSRLAGDEATSCFDQGKRWLQQTEARRGNVIELPALPLAGGGGRTTAKEYIPHFDMSKQKCAREGVFLTTAMCGTKCTKKENHEGSRRARKRTPQSNMGVQESASGEIQRAAVIGPLAFKQQSQGETSVHALCSCTECGGEFFAGHADLASPSRPHP